MNSTLLCPMNSDQVSLMKLLLDTHVFLWLRSEPNRLSPRVLNAYYPISVILTAGARRRHALPERRSCAGSAGMPRPGAHASGVPL